MFTCVRANYTFVVFLRILQSRREDLKWLLITKLIGINDNLSMTLDHAKDILAQSTYLAYDFSIAREIVDPVQCL